METPRLAAWAGLRRLRLKDESRNPTASFKDRASAVGVARALAKRARVVACASTGNLAGAVAAHAAIAGMEAYIFIQADLEQGKIIG